jgi:Uncharacterized MobA-related protein
MGRPKLSLELAPGKRLGGAALAEVLGCVEVERVIAVVRTEDELEWCKGAAMARSGDRLAIVRCPDAAEGMSRSILCGLREALKDEPDALLIVLADQPFIDSSRLTSLIEAGEEKAELDYVAFGRGGTAHPPVLIKRGMYGALEELEGDEGARRLLANGSWRGRLLDPEAAEFFADVDTLEDWERASAVAELKFSG